MEIVHVLLMKKTKPTFLFRIWNKTKTLGPQMSKVSSKNMIFFLNCLKRPLKLKGVINVLKFLLFMKYQSCIMIISGILPIFKQIFAQFRSIHPISMALHN